MQIRKIVSHSVARLIRTVTACRSILYLVTATGTGFQRQVHLAVRQKLEQISFCSQPIDAYH